MENSGGCIAVLFLIGKIGAIVLSGYLSWNWIEPDSFGSVMLFLVLWALLIYPTGLVFYGAIYLLSELFN